MPLPAVYVGNLPWATSADDLRQLFGAFGQVEVRGPSAAADQQPRLPKQPVPHPVVRLCLQDAFIPQDRESGRPRGFAFVTMASGADQAIANLNETEFQVRGVLSAAVCIPCPLSQSEGLGMALLPVVPRGALLGQQQ